VSNLQDVGRTVIAAKLVADVVGAEGRAAKAKLLTDMVEQGVERIRVKGDDNANLGAVSLTAGDPSAKVVDEQAFTDWVTKRYPAAVVPVVVPAFRKKLLDAATAAGDPVDTETGEVIPGVELIPGEPYLTCRPTDVARERMRETLTTSGLLAITSAEVDA
jgi:hypothetical protein